MVVHSMADDPRDESSDRPTSPSPDDSAAPMKAALTKGQGAGNTAAVHAGKLSASVEETIKGIEPQLPPAEPSEQPRMLEAAAPKRAAVGRSMRMLAMVRRAESAGLKAFVKIEETAPLAGEGIGAKPCRLEFPLDQEGTPQSSEIVLKLDSPDFHPKSQTKKLMVPLDRDSELCTFVLAPKVGGELLLNLEVFKGEVLVASREIRTVAEVTKQLLALGPNVLVSIPLEVIASGPPPTMGAALREDTWPRAGMAGAPAPPPAQDVLDEKTVPRGATLSEVAKSMQSVEELPRRVETSLATEPTPPAEPPEPALTPMIPIAQAPAKVTEDHEAEAEAEAPPATMILRTPLKAFAQAEPEAVEAPPPAPPPPLPQPEVQAAPPAPPLPEAQIQAPPPAPPPPPPQPEVQAVPPAPAPAHVEPKKPTPAPPQPEAQIQAPPPAPAPAHVEAKKPAPAPPLSQPQVQAPHPTPAPAHVEAKKPAPVPASLHVMPAPPVMARKAAPKKSPMLMVAGIALVVIMAIGGYMFFRSPQPAGPGANQQGGTPNIPQQGPQETIPAPPAETPSNPTNPALEAKAEFDAAAGTQNRGDLQGALRRFEAIAEKPGTYQLEAKARIPKIHEMIDNAGAQQEFNAALQMENSGNRQGALEQFKAIVEKGGPFKADAQTHIQQINDQLSAAAAGQQFEAAARVQSSGDLNGALALFKALAANPGPRQSDAQQRVQSITDQITQQQAQQQFNAAEQAQNNGDLKGALAQFKVLASKPSPLQPLAQAKADLITQLLKAPTPATPTPAPAPTQTPAGARSAVVTLIPSGDFQRWNGPVNKGQIMPDNSIEGGLKPIGTLSVPPLPGAPPKAVVIFIIAIDPNGNVTPGRKTLDDAGLGPQVMAAAKGWRFNPPTVRGKPVSTSIQVKVSF